MTDDFAVLLDTDKVLPVKDARKIVNAALDDPDTELIAIILRKGDDFMVPVMGNPTPELAEILRQAADIFSRLFGLNLPDNGHRH